MDLKSYASSGSATYGELAAVVLERVERIAADAGMRVLAIQKRTKDAASLRRKLQKLDAENSTAIDNLIKDLAGVRLVLYHDRDVQRFQEARRSVETLEIDWSRSKLHYPGGSLEEPDSHFIGDNYVVTLKSDDPAVIANLLLRGLRCELQVQTALNHVWSETAHDTIYKPPELHDIGKRELARLDERMKRIARERLMPAGHEMQKVLTDFDALARGIKLEESEALITAQTSATNDERIELLERFRDDVAPLIDNPEERWDRVRSQLLEIAKNARNTPAVENITAYGTFPGRTSAEVIDRICEIIERLWPANVEGTFETLLDLFANATTESEKARIVRAGEQMSKPKLWVWRKYGPAVQVGLAHAIAALPAEKKKGAEDLSIRVLENILSIEITGSEWKSEAVSFQTGATPPSPELVEARQIATTELQKLYRSEVSEEARLRILAALKAGSSLPRQVQYGDDVLAMSLRHGQELIGFFTQELPRTGIFERSVIERFAQSLNRQSRSVQKGERFSQEAKDVASELEASLLQLRVLINQDAHFVKFKTLIGFSSVMPPDWDNDDVDIERARTYRLARADEYVAEIDPDNSAGWLTFVKDCAAYPIRDGADRWILYALLEKIGERRPEIAKLWLSGANEPSLQTLFSKLLVGLERVEPEAAQEFVSLSILHRVRLLQAAVFLSEAISVDGPIVTALAEAALEADDHSAVSATLDLMLRRLRSVGVDAAKSLLLPLVRYLSDRKDTSWTSAAGMWLPKSGLIEALDERDFVSLLTLISVIPQIEHWEEVLLAAAAKRLPSEVLRVFGHRFERSRSRDDFEGSFEAMPFEFGELPAAFEQHVDAAVAAAFAWSKDRLTTSETPEATFVAKLFPELNSKVLDRFTQLVRSGDTKQVHFFLLVARAYDGDEKLLPLYREVLATIPPDERLTALVGTAVNAASSSEGAYGRADEERRRIELLKPWLDDASDRVRDFAKAEIHRHELGLAVEVRRVEAELAARRLAHDESPVIEARKPQCNLIVQPTNLKNEGI